MSAAELQELGLTPEQLAERRQKVSEMLKRNEPTAQEQEAGDKAFTDSAEKSKDFWTKPLSYKERAPRKDKGVPRKPRQEPAPEPQKAGAITEEQGEKIKSLMRDLIHAREEYAAVRSRLGDCEYALDAFVDSLTKG